MQGCAAVVQQLVQGGPVANWLAHAATYCCQLERSGGGQVPRQPRDDTSGSYKPAKGCCLLLRQMTGHSMGA